MIGGDGDVVKKYSVYGVMWRVKGGSRREDQGEVGGKYRGYTKSNRKNITDNNI